MLVITALLGCLLYNWFILVGSLHLQHQHHIRSWIYFCNLRLISISNELIIFIRYHVQISGMSFSSKKRCVRPSGLMNIHCRMETKVFKIDILAKISLIWSTKIIAGGMHGIANYAWYCQLDKESSKAIFKTRIEGKK